MSKHAALGIVLLTFAVLGLPVAVCLLVHPHRWWLVALISIIAGWTVIGWIVALYIALKRISPLQDELPAASANVAKDAVMVTVMAQQFRGKGYAEWSSSGLRVLDGEGNPRMDIPAQEIEDACFAHSSLELSTLQHGHVSFTYGSLFHRIEGSAATVWGGQLGTPMNVGGRLLRTEGGVISAA